MLEIRRVGVLGCGLMGGGIAQVCAQAGYETVVREVADGLWEKGFAAISQRLARAVETEKITATDRETALGRLHGTTRLEDLAECDLIIEAVVEDLETKNGIWRTLEELCAPRTIFASNTSSLTITDMAAATDRPERMVGLHFFNPVPIMQLVEVVRTITTEPAVFDAAFRFAASLGKQPVACRDRSGFIVNRLLVPYMVDAVRALEQGVGTLEDIDTAMRLGAGHPMGPFTLCDFVGIDTLARIGDIMFAEYREPRFASPPLLKRMVALGYYGRKSGKGFYDYTQDPPRPVELGLAP